MCNPVAEDEAFRAYKIRMHPTSLQVKGLLQWFYDARQSYNRLVHALQHDGCRACRVTFDELMADKATVSPAVLAVDPKVRRQAMLEAVGAFTSNEAKQRKHPIKTPYRVKFRSHKADHTETVVLEGASFKATTGKIDDTGSLRGFKPHPDEPIWPADQALPKRDTATGRRRRRVYVCFWSSMADAGPIPIQESDVAGRAARARRCVAS